MVSRLNLSYCNRYLLLDHFNVHKLTKILFYFTSHRGPYYLGTYDLAKIKDSGALFIRKVSKELDPNLLHLLPVNHKDEIPHIEWPNEINLSAKIEAKFY